MDVRTLCAFAAANDKESYGTPLPPSKKADTTWTEDTNIWHEN